MKLVCCCAIVVLGACNASQDNPRAERPWGPASAGLRMTVWVTPSDTEKPGTPQVHVAIENVGESDVVLNLGIMVAHRMYPLAIELVLTGANGRISHLKYLDPPVAGRVDDYLVALRAGSMHALRLALDRYFDPSTALPLRVARGPYRIQARFTGWEARSINGDTIGLAQLHFWTGTVQSNVAAFTNVVAFTLR